MASNWPSSPNNGDTYVAGNGTTYTYNSTTKSWKATGSGGESALTAGFGIDTDKFNNDNQVAVNTDKIADTDWVKANAAGILDLAYNQSQETTTIRLRDIDNNTNLDTLTIADSRTYGITTSSSGSFLDIKVDTEIIAKVEDISDGRLLAGAGLEYPSGQSFNANNPIDATLMVDTDWFDNRDLTWANIVTGGSIGASGTNSNSQSYLTYQYKSNTYYRVFVTGGESIRTNQNDAATEVVSKTYTI